MKELKDYLNENFNLIEDLKNLMHKLNVREIELAQNKGTYGKVFIDKNDSLKYDSNYALRRYNRDEFAFSEAWSVLKEHEKSIKDFQKNSKKSLTTNIYYKDFNDASNSYEVSDPKELSPYGENDAKESGVKITPKCEIKGTIDQLRKFLSLTNNHQRYTRTGYSYTNDDVNTMLKIGAMFNLFAPYSSWDEYYTTGLVD